jgi:hypothetical protein
MAVSPTRHRRRTRAAVITAHGHNAGRRCQITRRWRAWRGRRALEGLGGDLGIVSAPGCLTSVTGRPWSWSRTALITTARHPAGDRRRDSMTSIEAALTECLRRLVGTDSAGGVELRQRPGAVAPPTSISPRAERGDDLPPSALHLDCQRRDDQCLVQGHAPARQVRRESGRGQSIEQFPIRARRQRPARRSLVASRRGDPVPPVRHANTGGSARARAIWSGRRPTCAWTSVIPLAVQFDVAARTDGSGVSAGVSEREDQNADVHQSQSRAATGLALDLDVMIVAPRSVTSSCDSGEGRHRYGGECSISTPVRSEVRTFAVICTRPSVTVRFTSTPWCDRVAHGDQVGVRWPMMPSGHCFICRHAPSSPPPRRYARCPWRPQCA